MAVLVVACGGEVGLRNTEFESAECRELRNAHQLELTVSGDAFSDETRAWIDSCPNLVFQDRSDCINSYAWAYADPASGPPVEVPCG